MLLRPQALPMGLKNWEAEIVETTALEDSVASYAPTGHAETYPVSESGRGEPEDSGESSGQRDQPQGGSDNQLEEDRQGPR